MKQIEYRWRRGERDLASGLVWIANSWWSRARGLLGRPPLKANQALRILPCNSIHCFFMAYGIDVVFLDAEGRVKRLCPQVGPWRLRSCWSARSVVELAEGEITRLGLAEGDWFVSA